jgi:cellulose synthase/poly-beta-1,6-N-acetylglucosamine synthase-like glycosyltransferase
VTEVLIEASDAGYSREVELPPIQRDRAAIPPPIERVVVVIPARDEEDSIVACLNSIRAARRRLPSDVSCSVVVVADRCRDETIARAVGAIMGDSGDIIVDSHLGTVGAARQLGIRSALLDVPEDPGRVWIASTDADTVVPVDWLTTQLEIAQTGTVGAAGIVRLRRDERSNLALVDSFDRSYSHGDGRHHPHVHGANMGFRADAFQSVGGWNSLATGEDHDLWNRLREVGPVVASTALWVTTSARLAGRAPSGFAAELALLDSSIVPVA